MVTMEIAYQGNLRCSIIHTLSGTELLTDAPRDNHGLGESFSPTDLVASALGSCMLTTMAIVAGRENIGLEHVSVRVDKHMAATPTRRISRLVVAFTMPPGLGESARITLEKAAHTCPVAICLNPEISIEVTFRYPDQLSGKA